jgi:hypothetical protein
MNARKAIWYACTAGVVLLCALCFSPLVIPAGESQPALMGLPRSLWLGLLLYIGVVLLTVIATRVHPEAGDRKGDPE